MERIQQVSETYPKTEKLSETSDGMMFQQLFKKFQLEDAGSLNNQMVTLSEKVLTEVETIETAPSQEDIQENEVVPISPTKKEESDIQDNPEVPLVINGMSQQATPIPVDRIQGKLEITDGVEQVNPELQMIENSHLEQKERIEPISTSKERTINATESTSASSIDKGNTFSETEYFDENHVMMANQEEKVQQMNRLEDILPVESDLEIKIEEKKDNLEGKQLAGQPSLIDNKAESQGGSLSATFSENQSFVTHVSAPLSIDIPKLEQGHLPTIEKATESLAQPIREELHTMTRPNEKVIHFELSPAQLGKVQVKMKVTAQAVTLELTVQSEETKKIFESLTSRLDKVLQKQESIPVFSVAKLEEMPMISDVKNSMTMMDFSSQGFTNQERSMQRQPQQTSSKYVQQLSEDQLEEKNLEGKISILA